MANLRCVCGELVRMSEYPAPGESSLIPESNIIATSTALNAKKSKDEIFDIMTAGSRSVYECRNCRRLWVEDAPEGEHAGRYTCYEPCRGAASE